MQAQITGSKEIEKVLMALPKRLAQGAVTSSARSGALVIRKAIISAAPRGSGPLKPKYGRLYKNIKATTMRSLGAGLRAHIRIHTGKAFWGKFIEEGTKERPAVRKRPGQYRRANLGGRVVEIKSTGRISPRPWFHPAADANFEAAKKKTGDVLWSRIEKAVENLSGSFAKYKNRVSKRKRIF